MAYRNAIYIPREEAIRLYHWDEEGNRITTDYTFNPYLYTEVSGEGEHKSIFNTSLRKKIFRTGYERFKYVQECGNSRIFENIAPVHQFLIDRYWKENEKSDFSQFPLRIVYVDIEYKVEGAFVAPDNPTQPVNVITIYDSLYKCFRTWGTGGDFKTIYENSYYTKCNTEKEMLDSFLHWFESDYPDVLSGWNTEFFDIPYLINRITRVFSEDEIRRFSPTGNVYNKQIMGPYGRPITKWYLEGVSCLDYLEVYRTFSQGQKESYKLNDIAELEIKQKKIDYGNIDLGQLAEQDWQKFVEYNIQDVNLLVKMEEKLMYLQLVRMLAYVGLTPLESALGTLTTVTGAAIIQARQLGGLVVPTFELDSHDQGKIPGAFVAEPLQGFQNYIVSFDINSLYPNTMITLNLSPETKVGVIEEQDEVRVKLRHVTGKEYNLSREAFDKFIKAENIAVSKSGALFTQKKKGIFPLIVDKFYDIRLQIQKDLDETNQKVHDLGKDHSDYAALKDKSEKLDIRQFTIKILINRIYGYFANKHAPMGDRDIAMSITLTGQATIKKSGEVLCNWINEKAGTTGTTKALQRVVYNDTDSAYITLKPIVEAGVKLIEDGKLSPKFLTLADELAKHINIEIKKWGEAELNSKDCRFQFKREAICDVALFLQKKRYILHILNMKGIPCDKFKYVGVEVVRSTLPKAIKPYIKELIELMLLSQDYNKVNQLLCKTYEIFKGLPVEKIATVSGINKLEDYTSRCDGLRFPKGMPHHVKAAYMYNYLLKELKLTSKYEQISSGDKIRFFYVKKPNKYRRDKIAFKYYYPEEFKTIFECDYEVMFEKEVYSILSRLYEAVKWTLRKPGEQTVTDLFELFKL